MALFPDGLWQQNGLCMVNAFCAHEQSPENDSRKMSTLEERPACLGGTPTRQSAPPTWPIADAAVQESLLKCLHAGDWGRYAGPFCQQLVHELATRHAVEHVFLCSSGTAAIELALRGLNISTGDEVLLAGYDFKGNFLDVLTVGARPILIDVNPTTGQLDVTQIAEACTDRTRAVIASHLHGGQVWLPKLRQAIDDRGIAIIEDACQMPLAPLSSHLAGTAGDVGVISFGGSKLLTAGRGGAIVTHRADVAARIRRYNERGNTAYPLSELQAAVLLPQLAQLDERRIERRQRVSELAAALADGTAVELMNPPDQVAGTDYYKVLLRYHAEACDGLSRDQFAQALQAEGMAIYPGFRGLHLIHARSRFRTINSLLQATRADAEWLVLHHPVLLAGSAAVQEVARAITKIQRFAAEIREANLPDRSPFLLEDDLP